MVWMAIFTGCSVITYTPAVASIIALGGVILSKGIAVRCISLFVQMFRKRISRTVKVAL